MIEFCHRNGKKFEEKPLFLVGFVQHNEFHKVDLSKSGT